MRKESRQVGSEPRVYSRTKRDRTLSTNGMGNEGERCSFAVSFYVTHSF